MRLELHAQAKNNRQPLNSPKLIRFHELTEDEYFCTEAGAKNGVTFENTSETEPLVMLRYFGPVVNPDGPALEAHRRNKSTWERTSSLMPIPPLNPDGLLPVGIHETELFEIRQRFGTFRGSD